MESDYDYDEDRASDSEDFDQDSDDEIEQVFEAEVDVSSRVQLGLIESALTALVGSADICDNSREMNRRLSSPMDKFGCQVYIEAKRLRGYEAPGGLGEGDIVAMLNFLVQVKENSDGDAFAFPHIGDKNAQGFILGFLASNGGRNPTPENFQNVVKTYLSGLAENYVKPEDVLRYSRFCEKLRSNYV
jgi:hypothetical protein